MNQTVAVTSGTRGAAKTTSVVALGRLLADTGYDVLLVDADFSSPSLAERFGVDSAATIQDVLAGDTALRDALHTVRGGLSVLPCTESNEPAPPMLSAVVDALDGFDVVLCDTGNPFSDVTTGVLDAADGVLVVSTPDAAAQQNTATLHKELRDGNVPPLLGTVLTRVVESSARDEWNCEVLASIPETDAAAVASPFVLESPSDPASVAYHELAGELIDSLRAERDPVAETPGMWLPAPTDPFVTPASTALAAGDEETSPVPASDGGNRLSTVGTDGAASASVAEAEHSESVDVTEDGTDDVDSTDEGEKVDGGGFTLTRRGALAAITAAIGGVSAGILNTSETPEIEAFGYGGTPVPANESSTATSANDTTSAGDLSSTGGVRLEATNETETESDTETQTESETGTDVENETQTETGTDAGNATDLADPGSEDQVENETDLDGETPTETETGGETATGETGGSGDGGSDDGTDGGDETGTGGGNGRTGGGGDGGSDDGTGGGDETGTGGGNGGTGGDGGSDGGDGTNDEPSSPNPGDEPYGTVGYGQGRYGGAV